MDDAIIARSDDLLRHFAKTERCHKFVQPVLRIIVHVTAKESDLNVVLL